MLCVCNIEAVGLFHWGGGCEGEFVCCGDGGCGGKFVGGTGVDGGVSGRGRFDVRGMGVILLVGWEGGIVCGIWS